MEAPKPDVVLVKPAAQPSPLPADHPLLAKVKAALGMGFAGVILSGPPGTGKSWYARQIGESIAGDLDAIRIIQFHTSYQYEDFMEGFAPDETGNFAIEQKLFPTVCGDAAERPDITHVLLIDEISRCDVARVFGEALTYLEADKRGLPFTLASGSTLVVPQNLVIIATMNPWDKGVDELDVALERRFAQIDMAPSTTALRTVLADEGADPAFIDRVAAFFDGIQALEDEFCHLGHAYFLNCVDEESARQIWDLRLFPSFKRACRLDSATLSTIAQMWLKVVPSAQSAPSAGESTDLSAGAVDEAAQLSTNDSGEQ